METVAIITTAHRVVDQVLFCCAAALATTAFVLWPKLKSVMIPYHKEGCSGKIGFISFERGFRAHPLYRLSAFYEFLLPTFTAVYVFLVILYEYQFSSQQIVNEEFFLQVLGIWALGIFIVNKPMSIVVIFLGPFVVGYFFTGTVYGGTVSAALVAAIAFAVSYEDSFVFSFLKTRLQIKTHRDLTGQKLNFLNRICLWFKYFLLILNPLAMIATLFFIIWYSKISAYNIALRYLPSPPANLLAATPFIWLFVNISFRAFGGVFDFLQLDFLREVGESLLTRAESSGESKQDTRASVRSDPTGSKHPTGPSKEDRILSTKAMAKNNFRVALTYFSLDTILTVSSILGLSLIPGLTATNVATLSVIIKVPLYVVFIVRSQHRLYLWLRHKYGPLIRSETEQEEAERELQFYRSARKLLGKMQEQQIAGSKYIDLGRNKYLLRLAGH